MHKGKLYQWEEKFPPLLSHSETRSIINSIVAYESVNKRRESLSEFSISGRYCNHFLRLLTKPDSASPQNLIRHAKTNLFGIQKKGRSDDENNVLADDELVTVWNFLKTSKHSFLCIQIEHLGRFKVLDYV